MRALLSIKPEFSQQIFSGNKRFEYRKTGFTKPVDTVIVYESSPTSMVVGHFLIGRILQGDPEKIWEKTCHASGIDQERFFAYFEGKNTAFAIEVIDAIQFSNPIPLSEVYDSRPPQSFAYLESSGHAV